MKSKAFLEGRRHSLKRILMVVSEGVCRSGVDAERSDNLAVPTEGSDKRRLEWGVEATSSLFKIKSGRRVSHHCLVGGRPACRSFAVRNRKSCEKTRVVAYRMMQINVLASVSKTKSAHTVAGVSIPTDCPVPPSPHSTNSYGELRGPIHPAQMTVRRSSVFVREPLDVCSTRTSEPGFVPVVPPESPPGRYLERLE